MRCATSARYDGAMILRFCSVAAIWALCLSTALADPIFPPGSRIGLEPPRGMAPSDTGFADQAHGAMLVVTELSAQSYARVAQDFAPERMRAGGMEPLRRETIALPGGDGLLVVARQTENGVPVRKWALLTRTEDITVIVIATLPEAAREAYPDAVLRAALGSVTVRAKLPLDEMLGVLPYRLGDLGGFRLLRANPDGTAVLTFGPHDTTLPVEQPYFMVAPRAVEPPPAAERERFAQRALMTFVNRPDLRIVGSEPIRVDGAPGHEIIAESRDSHTGDEFMTVQWLRFGTGGVVQMFGVARKDQWAEILPRMRALRDGFARR
jgi:hypothetical protein